MAKNNIIGKLNTVIILKASLIISFLTELSLFYLNTIIEGNIKYFGYSFFILGIILTIITDKDLLFLSLKNQRKITFLKNVYLGLFIFVLIYYPISFYKNYLNLKDSYTFLLFIISIITTVIFHFLLILMLNNYIKSKKSKKNNESTEELIEEEIKDAMINEK